MRTDCTVASVLRSVVPTVLFLFMAASLHQKYAQGHALTPRTHVRGFIATVVQGAGGECDMDANTALQSRS